MKHRVFLWICIFALTPAKGFLGVGKLVHHYFEHRELNKNLGVAEFLFNHYASEKHEQDGHPNTDHQLPFLTLDAVLLIPHWNSATDANFWSNHLGFVKEIDRPIARNYSGITGVRADIWQPPKLG